MMKTLAMYLPQFYKTKENDEWWGDGFTDWIAAKKAESLFENHKQPRIPYGNNYYNLLDKATMEWQADLLKKYEIDGLVFYHYYFQNGVMMLEKPVENLLIWKNINMPFCFSWANESWIRTWGNIPEGNAWSQVFDKKSDSKDNDGILVKQSYGDKLQWEKHFNYLIPFFKDSRYIYEDGKPVFIFHRPNNIPCLYNMVQCWKELAKKNGLKGLYLIGVNTENISFLDGTVYLEPQYTMSNYTNTLFKEQNIRTIYDYDDIWDSSIRNVNKKVNCLGAFVDYDNTPRHGKNGTVVMGASPEKFKKYMQLLFYKANKEKSKYIFINAWNEWGEGMYLEPDEENKYEYLEAFLYAKNHYKQMQGEFEDKYENSDVTKSLLIEINNLKSRIERFKTQWRVTDYWMTEREQRRFLVNKLIYLNFHDIAIYGMGSLSKHLIWEIDNYNKIYGESLIFVKYGIDQGDKQNAYAFPVFKLTDNLPNVDVIIVTVVYEFETIRQQLAAITNCEILSLEGLFID